jgi:ketosteroid isomerase-like protein
MALEDELYGIEEGFWLSGKDHFLAHLDERCMLVFPQAGQMHGVLGREDIAATASTPNRWRDLRISNRKYLEIADDVSAISYRADVLRADGEPYSALVSSVYAARDEGWKLVLHQHSPMMEGQ